MPRALTILAVGLGLLALFCVHARRSYIACYTGGGDSPHYLMMARSLARDGDLKLSKLERSLHGNFEDFPLELEPRLFSEARPYSIHPVGAPVLFAPGYALGGRQGVLFELALLATLTAVALWQYLAQVTGDGAAAGWVTLSLSLAVPFVPLAANEYTEMPALHLQVLALLLAAGVRGDDGDRLKLLLVGLAAGALPWLHVRYAPVSAAVAGAALWRAGLRRGPRVWLVAPAAALVAGLYAWGWHVTGAFAITLPMTLSGSNAASTLSISTLFTKGLLGHLTDQQGGLLVYAPHCALALLGAAEVWRRWRGEALVHLGYAVPTLLVVASYHNWSGHWGVPCRFLAVLLPGIGLMLVPVVRAAMERGAAGLLAVAPPLACGLLISGAMLRWPPLQLSLESPGVNLGAPFVHLFRETGCLLLTALPRFIYTPRARDYYLAYTLLMMLGCWLHLASRLLWRAPARQVARAAVLFAVSAAVWWGTAAALRPAGDPLAEDPRWHELDVEHLLGYPRFYELLAARSMARNRIDIARRSVERILEVKPGYGPAYAQMASVVMPVRRDEGRLWAARGLEVIDDLAVQVPERLFWRGFLHYLAGHGAEARADLSEYLRRPGPQAPLARRLVQELGSVPGTGR